MDQVFIQLSVILLAAFLVSYIVRALNQPIIVGYIVAGIIISPFIIKLGASTDVINTFSQFGIAFLLFIVGLHLNPKVIKEIGFSSLIVGLGQMILTFGVGFLVSWKALGFDIIDSSFIGIALAFSSTIIVMKLLSDKGQLDSLFGKISTGVLIIQDLVAIGVLMFISSINGGLRSVSLGFEGIILGICLIAGLFLVGYLLLPRITRTVAKNQELLFLFSICWCFVIAALFSFIGFSMEIGALVAGVILSISPYSTEISSKIRPLRDFFLIIFFIILGLKTQITNLGPIIVNALIFSGITLILKPAFVMFFMRIFKYTRRTNFLVGTTLGQISEFSIIILALGVSLNHIGSELLNTMILSLLISVLLSTYMIIYGDLFYKKILKLFALFGKDEKKVIKKAKKEYDAILFGYNRIGFSILNSLKALNKSYLVVDFNPDTINNLNKFRVPALYGDAFDMELLENLALDKVELIVSTIPDPETNHLLIEAVREVNPNAIIILRSHTIEDALDLYRQGANYVLTPHFLGGEYVARLIKEAKFNRKEYEVEKRKHINLLNDVAKQGHKHPDIERN